jgi:hypothetical protein
MFFSFSNKENVQGSDKLMLLYSVLPNHSVFDALYDFIQDVELNYLGWAVQKLEKIDQLLLPLMKPRLNAPHLDVAQKFSMSQATVSNIFLTYIHAIHETWGTSSFLEGKHHHPETH